MRLLIVTHVQHFYDGQKYFGYGPYVKEMNLWLKHSDSVEVVGHIRKSALTPIDLAYNKGVMFTEIPAISLTSVLAILSCLWRVPVIFFRLLEAMRRADHIHLRCPGNIGLLGALAQIFFPSKVKTAKYAGNWDPKAKQPRSYKIQKRLLSSTFWTKKMQTLVYGDWPNQTENIKPFFTATYSETLIPRKREYEKAASITCIFVGSLAPGKRPLYALEFIKACREKGISVTLDMYGEGKERPVLEEYIANNNLSEYVKLHGNQNAETVQERYRSAHFLMLPSKSEGWPKVIAEAMFWGVIPLVTPISCVPWMLDHGNRGILLTLNVNEDVSAFAKAIPEPEKLQHMITAGQHWSHQYTLESFEQAIKKQLLRQ